MSRPLAYFLTWTCYGQRLHGDVRGSVDHLHNSRGTPTLPPDAERETFERERMTRDTFKLNTECAAIATDAIQRLCEDREWDCLAVNVRQTHVHVVVSCPVAPERAIADFKARITRDLRRKKLVSEDARLWTIHGSTR
ncbi:MAG: transposase [Phycisphaeraceae bacterium]|nr:transposase [Phycisphaeraceae bacterium]